MSWSSQACRRRRGGATAQLPCCLPAAGKKASSSATVKCDVDTYARQEQTHHHQVDPQGKQHITTMQSLLTKLASPASASLRAGVRRGLRSSAPVCAVPDTMKAVVVHETGPNALGLCNEDGDARRRTFVFLHISCRFFSSGSSLRN